MTKTPATLFVLGLTLLTACDSKKGSPTPATSGSTASEVTAAASTAPPSTAANDAGPVISIPAGTLVAGSACGDHPRLPSEELPGVKFEMNAFDIDQHPYPNQAGARPRTGVTREEAQKLCTARGRRLCTELEWERACKGPKNTMYEYGNRFDAKKCPSAASPSGSSDHPECKSAFGVEAMHGSQWEWTASAWGRGGDADLVTLRGGFGSSPYAHMRCANVKASLPGASDGSIGFRCCGGTANTASVDIPAPDAPLEVVEAVSPIEDAVAARFTNALRNGGVPTQEGTAYEFTRAWRWRPVVHEELFVIERRETPTQGSPSVRAFVVHLCPARALLRSQLRGPADSFEAPTAQDGKLKLEARAGSNTGTVVYTYQFGQVQTVEPAWMQAPPAPSAASANPASP
jgi:formylglycine-generating enzyme required for sulfatase activity